MNDSKKFNKDYHNNPFNFLISKKSDKRRSIMDLDCFISKSNCENSFIIDHKKLNDKVSLNTLRQLSKLVDVKLNDNTTTKCFILKSDIDVESTKTNNYSMIYEVKSLNEIKDEWKAKKEDFIRDSYTIVNDEILVDFFKPEKHKETKIKLKNLSKLMSAI